MTLDDIRGRILSGCDPMKVIGTNPERLSFWLSELATEVRENKRMLDSLRAELNRLCVVLAHETEPVGTLDEHRIQEGFHEWASRQADEDDGHPF